MGPKRARTYHHQGRDLGSRGAPEGGTLARLLMQMVMVKQMGNMGAIISRNMATSLRMSAKSLGEGIRGQRSETFILEDSPPLSSSPFSPPLLGITVHFAPVGEERLVCNLDLRRKHSLWAVQAIPMPWKGPKGSGKPTPQPDICLQTLSLLPEMPPVAGRTFSGHSYFPVTNP